MKHKLPMYYGAAIELFKFAEAMRLSPTDGEKAMWNMLKIESLSIYKFRRQHPISTFIADFYSHKLKLVIEIDGGYHLDRYQKEYDDFRDEDMQAMGITVVRFTNEDIVQNSQAVLQTVLEQIQLCEKTVNAKSTD